MANQHKDYPALIALHCSRRQWKDACFFHLKSLQACCHHLDDFEEQVLAVVKFYMMKMVDSHADSSGGSDDMKALIHLVRVNRRYISVSK